MDDIEAELKKFEIKETEPEVEAEPVKSKVSCLRIYSIGINIGVILSA